MKQLDVQESVYHRRIITKAWEGCKIQIHYEGLFPNNMQGCIR